MNDYWNYLKHGLKGKEQKGHKYYARVPVGTNKLGFTQYRYFYDAREYGAYMTNKQNGNNKADNPRNTGNKRATYYVSGKGTAMMPSNAAHEYTTEARTNNRYGYGKLETDGKNGETASGQFFTGRAKTVRDHKTLRNLKHAPERIARKGKAKIETLIRNAKKSHSENRWANEMTVAVGSDYLYRSQRNRINGKTHEVTLRVKNVATSGNLGYTPSSDAAKKKAERKRKRYEAVYKADTAYHKVSVASKKGALTVKRLLKNAFTAR